MASFVHDVLGALLVFAPAGLANAAPVLVVKIPWIQWLARPLDMGKSWRGKRIFGANKTWRGILAGAGMGAFIGAAQTFFIDRSDWLANDIDIVGGQIDLILLGAVIGTGALIGDAVESFFKRQLDVPPGKSWLPFDQIDYIIGGMVFLALLVDLRPIHYIVIFVSYGLAHPIFSFLGYSLGLKKDKL